MSQFVVKPLKSQISQLATEIPAPVAGERWPIELPVEKYDRRPDLSEQEQEVVSYVYSHPTSRSQKQRKAVLQRLLQPLTDVLVAIGSPRWEHYAPIRVLLGEMARRETAYWGWSSEEWLETVAPTLKQFRHRHGLSGESKARQQVVIMAYLLTGFTDFLKLQGHDLPTYRTACTIFGKQVLEAAVERICATLASRGYSAIGPLHRVTSALATAFLANHSPKLEELKLSLLVKLREESGAKGASAMFGEGLGLISCALVDLGIEKAELGSARSVRKATDRIATDNFSAEWLKWIKAWHDQSTLSRRTKENYLCYLRKVGLWLAQQHPEVSSPEQWDYALALEFVATVNQMKVGDYVTVSNSACFASLGKELTPRSKDNCLMVMRRFFSDLQEKPHRLEGADHPARCITRNFNPHLAFQTPASIRNLIGPDPRVIEDSWWWKLNQAALELSETDLPHCGKGWTRYPFTMVRALAITWCYSALRSDEIKRLRVGCIRRQWGADMQTPEGIQLPEDATCFLHVPVNKTGTAFWKPVYALVGKYINEWEKERPVQPLALDPKTNELVSYLFSYRGRRIGDGYLNEVLIPLLCEKAGVPSADTRGKITCHRARATIATLYYNCPEGLSGPEIQEFLGHRDFRSTQSYLKVSPTKLAKSVARANQNSRLVKVLVDPKAVVAGEPALFYDLGDGTFCGNPAWAACAHRMACIKCPMHIGVELAQLIRAREGIMHLLQEVPNLSQEEKEVAEGDRLTLERLIEKYQGVEPPPVPDARYIFNPAALELPLKGRKSSRVVLPLSEKKEPNNQERKPD